MVHDEDPRKVLLDRIGDLSHVEVFNNQALCAVYLRPEKTKSGIYLPDKHRDEDQFQSKVGLLIKTGPSAFIDSGDQWFSGVNIQIHDWLVFRPSDGWSITVNGVLCRMLDDINIRGRISHPDQVW
jgi:co-chaperonin GroES (HSP10)